MLNDESPYADRSAANGSATTFAYTFTIYASTAIAVYDNTTLKTFGVDYSLTGVGTQGGGNVVFLVAPLVDHIITRVRLQPAAQLSDYIPNEAFPSARLEQDLDLLAMQIQQIKEQLRRGFFLPISSSLANQGIDEPTVGEFARGKVGGGIEWSPVEVVAGTIAVPLAVAQGGTGQTTSPFDMPTFTGNLVTITGNNHPTLLLNTTHASNARTELDFKRSSATRWIVGVDFANDNTNDFYFYDGLNALRTLILEATGVVSFPIGQLKFPATANPSADANTMDDYQESPWTPSLGGNATYTSRSGQITKTGRHIHLEWTMVVNAIGTGSTYQITGAPVAAGAIVPGVIYVSSAAASIVSASVIMVGSTIQCEHRTAGAASPSAGGLFGNGTTMYGSIDYDE